MVRLQKILAQAGVASRRACEALILEGRVTVDGQVRRQLGTKADPQTQTIALDGRKVAGPGRLPKGVRTQNRKVYYMLNKPKGVLCTHQDPAGRVLATHLIPEKRRLFCVGRLDKETEGLLLLTNDGEWTQRLTHPRYGVSKTYLARVDGKVAGGQVEKIRAGVHLSEGKVRGVRVRIRKRTPKSSVLELTLGEGMNREVRRILAAVGLRCRKLKRVRVGALKLGRLPVGAFRRLSAEEARSLYAPPKAGRGGALIRSSGAGTLPVHADWKPVPPRGDRMRREAVVRKQRMRGKTERGVR